MTSRVFSDEEIKLMVGYEWAKIREGWLFQMSPGQDIGDCPPVEISREKRVLGRCYYGRKPDGERYIKRIRLTRFFLHEADLRDTIRHEIAHATAYLIESERGHGHTWKRHAVIAGATPERCAVNVALTEPPTRTPFLTIRCPDCKAAKTFYRDCKTARFYMRGGTGRCLGCGFNGSFVMEKHRLPVRLERPTYANKPTKPAHEPLPSFTIPEE